MCIRSAPHENHSKLQASTTTQAYKTHSSFLPCRHWTKINTSSSPNRREKLCVCQCFFSFFFFPSFFHSFFLFFFLEIKLTSLPPHRHYKKPQAGHLTGINKLVQAYRPTGLRQTDKLIATQAAKLQAWHHTDVNKTTRLPPDRQQNYNLTATQAKNYKLTATQAKDYKLTATQMWQKTTSLPPHRQQNYRLTATQA